MCYRIVLISIAMSAQGIVFAAADYMKTFEVEVCGATVSMDLHPNMKQPGVRPKGLSEKDLPRPGDIYEFVHIMYDYRGSRKLEVDGSVIVVGTAVRRTIKRQEQGISFLDVDRLLANLKEAASEFDYEKVERGSGVWIKRTKLRDVPPGQGRIFELEWLAPIKKDILLIFRVVLHDYATRGSRKNAAWYQDAEAMQRRIFESVQVRAERR